MLSIALTNLGKYNEGDLVYKWLTLPFTSEQLENAKKRIGIDDNEYEEYFISDDDTTDEHEFLNEFVTEYANIDKLNKVVSFFDDLKSDKEKAAFISCIEDNSYTDISEVCDECERFNADNFVVYEGNVETIGLELLNEYLEGSLDSSSIKHLEPFFDAEAFGIDRLEDFNKININGDTFFVEWI